MSSAVLFFSICSLNQGEALYNLENITALSLIPGDCWQKVFYALYIGGKQDTIKGSNS